MIKTKRQYQCGACLGFGHNSTYCPANKIYKLPYIPKRNMVKSDSYFTVEVNNAIKDMVKKGYFRTKTEFIRHAAINLLLELGYNFQKNP